MPPIVRTICGTLLILSSSLAAGAVRPVDMKLLLLTATGSEPSYLAMRSALDHLGTPYLPVRLAAGEELPPLDDGSTGFFQGVILATGNLAVCDPACRSALPPNGWARLDAYAAAYSVRTLSVYTFPEPRYGITYRDGLFSPTDAPSLAKFTPEGASVFRYLRSDHPVSLAGAFAYLADPSPATGETTTPLLQLAGRSIGFLHAKPDGREYLALTVDHSPSLTHSLELSYGLIAWVTKGVFLGARRTYLTPQSDDLFLANNLFTKSGPCSPTEFTVNPAAPIAPDCPKIRIGGPDLQQLREWQTRWNAVPQTARFRVTMAYNGLGAKSADQDDLTAEALRSMRDFYWVNHTYTHKILDCYALTSGGTCRPASLAEGIQEIQTNFEVADRLGIPSDRPSLVTPAISGLANPEFLRAAVSLGIRYLVSDTSRPEGNPRVPNTGIHPESAPELLFIPRRATAIFYNTDTAAPDVPGSLPDEYNFFFGPAGKVRVGGTPDGPAFFSVEQTYADIVNRESDALLQMMLRMEVYPSMFHQSNFYVYQDRRSLFTDVIDATLRKFTAMSTLPVVSLPQTEIGRLLEARMEWLNAGARVTLLPEGSIRITVERAAKVPITGVCAEGCEEYGGEMQSYITAVPGAPAVVPLRHRRDSGLLRR